MSRASYSAWAKFDVEKELLRVDEVEQHEVQNKLQRQHLQAKQNVEASATQAAQRSADILAAQAAVAALKDKKRVREGAGVKNNAVEETKKLQIRAGLYAHKHKLLQQILEYRREGDKALTEKKDAKLMYEKALTAIKKLEELAPRLAEQEQEIRKESATLVSLETSQASSSNGKASHSCSINHCHKEQETSQTLDKTLPNANDLLAVIKMFYKDVYMGIGTCDLNEGRLAAATEAFKEVLIRDDVHLLAWLKRGEAFERMSAPLLAILHYNRITNLDSEHKVGTESLERVKRTLLSEGDAANDKVAIKTIVASYTEGLGLENVLERIQWTFEEANVLAVENFYKYSTTKYQVVLGCLKVLQDRQDISSFPTDCAHIFQQIAISCHLNIASSCLATQQKYAKGLRHCEQALELDTKDAMTHFRMGQLYHALHTYVKALQCFKIANSLVTDATIRLADKHRTQMADRIRKEINKCKFDRNQYDLEYLRSLASKEMQTQDFG